MNELKVIGQFLAAIVYTCIFTGLMYVILVFPLAWFLSLSTKTMILVGIFLGGAIEALLFGLQFLLMMPYAWIVKKNIVSLVVSIGLILFNMTMNDINVWKTTASYGTEGVVVAVIITLIIVQTVGMVTFALVGLYFENR